MLEFTPELTDFLDEQGTVGRDLAVHHAARASAGLRGGQDIDSNDFVQIPRFFIAK